MSNWLLNSTGPGILPKLHHKKDGPYEVIAVYNNETVRIQHGQGGYNHLVAAQGKVGRSLVAN